VPNRSTTLTTPPPKRWSILSLLPLNTYFLLSKLSRPTISPPEILKETSGSAPLLFTFPPPLASQIQGLGAVFYGSSRSLRNPLGSLFLRRLLRTFCHLSSLRCRVPCKMSELLRFFPRYGDASRLLTLLFPFFPEPVKFRGRSR